MVSYTSRSSTIPVSLAVFTLFSILVFLGLGFWQLERLQEKEILIQRLTQRLGAQPVDIKVVLNDSRDLKEYWNWRPVQLTGTWNAKENIILEARTHQGKAGVNVVTPFQLELGPTVLINRGWFSQKSQVVEQSLQKGSVTLTGVLRVKEQRGTFAPTNLPEKGEWYTLDVPEISKHLSLALAVPFFVVASEKIGEGKPVLLSANLPNNHLSYAITWFSLAVAILLSYLIYLNQLVRQRLDEFRQKKKRSS